ncbi:MAG: NAD(P)-binding domain-containing protein [Paracoccaceae bacterium]
MNDASDMSNGLAQLEAALAQDLARLNHPPTEWTPRRYDSSGHPVADVAIIGGGMCGLAAAFALRRMGIANIRQIDRRPPGLEGPWLTYARMQTLRSPKHLTGPALGFPNLTFRAWWEAKGRDWDRLDRILRPDWMAYLRWYARVTGALVENNVRLDAVTPISDVIQLALHGTDGPETLTARRVVLATGREGQASPRVPPPLDPFIGAEVRHSSDDIDFAALRGKEVVVIGLAASAFDNAATALEAGAARVTLIGRANAMPRLNKMKQTVYPGFTHGFVDLPDADKLALLDHVMQHRIAPPRASVLRISQDPNVSLVLGVEVTHATRGTTGLNLTTSKGIIRADRVILGTGFAIDLDAPAELSAVAGDILRWGDRVPQATGEWAAFPYLGTGFDLQGNDETDLSRIHCFTHTAQLSLGNLANDIPAVSEGADRLARAIAASLFVEDRAYHKQRLMEYAEPELLGDEWPGLTAWDPPSG